ncbi:GtrA-like protein [Marinomonas foliarum]|uniref:GtrA-like protein n=1 Tax=Marinomonas foliarum TaxID=491950 RepID=A0A368ZTR0_9GAMM|nr:GtrA-like protein [Marinomonas foliarum]
MLNVRLVIRFYLVKLLSSSLFRFFLNGGVIGLLSWILQAAFLYLFLTFDFFSEYGPAISVWLAFFIILFLNFFSMKKFVFNKDGSPLKFLISTTLMIFLAGLLTQFITEKIYSYGLDGFVYLSYPVSALLISPLSYVIKKNIVFN